MNEHEKVNVICENLCLEEGMTKKDIINLFHEANLISLSDDGEFYYTDILDREPVTGEVFRIWFNNGSLDSETGQINLSVTKEENRTATYPLKGINANQLNIFGRPVDVWFDYDHFEILESKSSISVGVGTNQQTQEITSGWSRATININHVINMSGNRLTLDTSTRSVSIGEGVRKVRISANGLVKGISGVMGVGVQVIRNNETVATYYAGYMATSNTTMWVHGGLGSVEMAVQENDEIKMFVTADKAGTATIHNESYTNLTVEQID